MLRDRPAAARRDLGAPIDVFWFRLPKDASAEQRQRAACSTPGTLVVLIDRGDYWQCAYRRSPRAAAEAIRGAGHRRVPRPRSRASGRSSPTVDERVKSWDEVKLLTVSLDRLTRWQRPGLLAIGDAAHAMSPVGGVGINLAIQDAVAAANILAGPLARGEDVDPLLAQGAGPADVAGQA